MHPRMFRLAAVCAAVPLMCAESASTLHNQAEQLRKLGRYEEAAPLYARALALLEQGGAAVESELAVVLNNAGALETAAGRPERAVAYHYRALEIRRRLYGSADPRVALVTTNLAAAFGAQGRQGEAEQLLTGALAVVSGVHAAIALNNLGDIYATTGRYAQAEPLYRRALQIAEKHFEPEDLMLATIAVTVGMLVRAQGKPAQAVPLLARALAIREKHLGESHPEVALVLDRLGSCHLAAGNLAAAEAPLRRALVIRERADLPELADSQMALGDWFLRPRRSARRGNPLSPRYQEAGEILRRPAPSRLGALSARRRPGGPAALHRGSRPARAVTEDLGRGRGPG